jgi:hypothetical protein
VPLTPSERILMLDTWQRSGLPAGDFAALVGVIIDCQRFEDGQQHILDALSRGRFKCMPATPCRTWTSQAANAYFACANRRSISASSSFGLAVLVQHQSGAAGCYPDQLIAQAENVLRWRPAFQDAGAEVPGPSL